MESHLDLGQHFHRLLPDRPHQWQVALAEPVECRDRLIRIPTGFGKTLGVLGAWSWHRLVRNDDKWPRRLVWCLPMRVLVEQTDAEVRRALTALGQESAVGVHVLMGGSDVGEWHLRPERPAVVIGTQDMLLSRALNRGYASPRARWPVEFGLLNHDCLWVMDEVQLMDVGFATSAQLQQFRNDDEAKGLRPCRTWWMSATLQPEWLRKSPDTRALADVLQRDALSISPEQRVGQLWDSDKISKPCQLEAVKDEKALAKRVASAHGGGANGPTLVVLNRVERAVKVFRDLCADKILKAAGTDIRLTHSRFRPHERSGWREAFLNRAACTPGTNRIIVATQVVEAGVDISAGVLFTELAPWASLVQRFGRCARWGGTAQVVVADFGANDEKTAAPYAPDELDAARQALSYLQDVSPLHLEQFEESHSELIDGLYPYDPKHLLLRHELDELFDTSADLSGADVDISRFIRSGTERDVQVLWREIPKKDRPDRRSRARREELCAVPFLRARDWLCGKESKSAKSPRLRKGVRAWVWDWLDGEWRFAERSDLYPGRTVLVDASCGGYDPQKGWDDEITDPVQVVDAATDAASTCMVACWSWDKSAGQRVITQRRGRSSDDSDQADATEDDESLSIADGWQTIAFHGRETGRRAAEIARAVAPTLEKLLNLAGRWHDAGKSHAAFGASIQHPEKPQRTDLAKAPDAAWPCWHGNLYRIASNDVRPGFRHELASTLALFAVLQRHDPDHVALRGRHRALLAALHPTLPGRTSSVAPTPLEAEVLALGREDFNLLAWLVCTHHGKVRVAWHTSAADQRANDDVLRIRGVREGDRLPALTLADAHGDFHEIPETALDLAPAAAGLNPYTGAGWTERVLGLLKDRGPFTLAWLEALMRAADVRASRLPLVDPLIAVENFTHGLERRHSSLEEPAAGGADAAPLGAGAGTDLAEHGFRARAREPGVAQGATRAPDDATRHIETAQGWLSYTELAQRLAQPLLRLDQRIRAGDYAELTLDEHLLLDLHRELCAGLFPDAAGRYRQAAVRVGAHEPPPAHQVPVRIRDYMRNLDARLAHLPAEPSELWLEALAYAEGELLSIHPFPDLNGRLSRLWLTELLRRMGLPPVDIVPTGDDFRSHYLAALAAADRRDWRPLAELWRERLARPGDEP